MSFLLVVFSVVILAIVALALLMLLLRVLARLALALVMASGTGVIAGILAADQDGLDGVATGLLVVTVAFVPTLLLVWRWLGPLEGGSADTANAARIAENGPSKPFNLSTDLAWNRAERLAPTRVGRIRTARHSCDRLLEKMDRGEMGSEFEWLDARVLISRHLAPLVSETEQACDGAEPAEKQQLIDNLIDRLEAIGQRAADLLEGERSRAKEALVVRDSHVANRLRAGPLEGPVSQAHPAPGPGFKLSRFRPWARKAR